MAYTIETLPPRRAACIRVLGAYGDPEWQKEFGGAFQRLMEWAGPAGLAQDSPSIGAYYDDPREIKPEECRCDAAIAIPADAVPPAGIEVRELPGGRYAVFYKEFAGNDFRAAWQDIMEEIGRSGAGLRQAPCYEIYRNVGCQEEEGAWKLDICVPVE